MSNCTGVIYGKVTNAVDGTSVPNADLSLNWIVRAYGPPLQVGGDDSLQTYVPHGVRQ